MHVVIMPKAGQTMEEGVVLRWLKREGDTVGADEVIVEIETDKAIAEVPSEISGVMRKILVHEGKTVPVLTPLAYVGGLEEELPGEEMKQDGQRVAIEPAQPIATTGSAKVSDSGPRAVSPRARRLAEERGVDIRLLEGSGPEGRVTEDDVKTYLDGHEQSRS